MLDYSKYSCDKCKRDGSWHCKRCWHTVNKKPTNFKPKKKTGIQTPEFRKPTPPPLSPMVMDVVIGFEDRTYKLEDGDIFWANDKYLQLRFNTTLDDVCVGNEIFPNIICIEKVKRKKRWQFWKPKYTGVRLMYVANENN